MSAHYISDVSELHVSLFTVYTHYWEQRKLGRFIKVVGGNAWKSKEYNNQGKYLVITIANVQGDEWIDDSVGNRINPSGSFERYLLRKGDILVSLTGNVGRVSKMTSTPAVLNQRVGKISLVSNKLNGKFLLQTLRDGQFELAMIQSGQGAAQLNISNSDILDYTRMFPTRLDEQELIGGFLSKLDHTIALHQEADHLS